MRNFSRRSAISLAATFAVMVCGSASAANRLIPLSEISSYFNAMKSASSAFTQVNEDGTLSRGNITIARPGRLRFDYAEPDGSLVLASGGQVAIFDGAVRQSEPQVYPLSHTPLSIFLERHVDLAAQEMVVAHTLDGPATVVRAQDPDHPDYGSIDLIFTDNPIQLRKWIITDEGGTLTTLILADLIKQSGLSNLAFNVEAERSKRTQQR
ncbi:LolA family protein [Loktanella sp. DJP18]|uniref:LolA family protein n=1 Tax=Loktanella sp. DJP18 TaxID=3409788 RepID=UPI003BB66DBA